MPSTVIDRIDNLTTSVAVKAPVRVATTAAITLIGLQTIDGVTVAEGDRVLVKDQSNTTENGIYIAASSSTTAWQRDYDFDGTRDAVEGSIIYVRQGSVNANLFFRLVCSDDPVVFGSSSLTFTNLFGNLVASPVPYVGYVTSIANMRLVEGNADGELIALVDTTGGIEPVWYRWDAASTATDDGATIVKPTSLSGAGRWLIEPATYIRWATSVANMRLLVGATAGEPVELNDPTNTVPPLDYIWNPTDSSADDGANVIKPTSVSGNGRWNLVPVLPRSRGGTGTSSFGAISGEVKEISADYVLLNSDSGKTLVATGSNQNTLTVGAHGGFDADFQVRIYNSKSRGEYISISGGTSFWLYPHQTATLFKGASDAWAVDRPTRWDCDLISGAIFYVATSAPDDTTNDGLSSSSPLKTILGTWNLIRDKTIGVASIQLEHGDTFAAVGGELVGDRSSVFGRLINISGDPTGAHRPQILVGAAQTCLELRDGGWAQLDGIKFGSSDSGSTGVAVSQGALADISNCDFASMVGGVHILVSDASFANITGDYVITGNSGSHWRVEQKSKLVVGSVNIDCGGPSSWSIAFLVGTDQANIVFGTGLTFSNTAGLSGYEYDLTRHSVVQSSGIIPPGSATGTHDASSDFY